MLAWNQGAEVLQTWRDPTRVGCSTSDLSLLGEFSFFRSSTKRIAHRQAAEALAVLKVFRVQYGGAAFYRGMQNQSVPE